ncbi:MAG TPA: hypothetical protein VGH73_10115 [Thermoanaerobaculia bacterium]|jgi:hypothetical protein
MPAILRALRGDITTLRAATLEFAAIQEVIFCCFSQSDLLVYEGLLGETAA